MIEAWIKPQMKLDVCAKSNRGDEKDEPYNDNSGQYDGAAAAAA
jgi:hypothetical protein